MIGPTQRPLPDNTQHSQETDIPAPEGIRTDNSSKLVAADRRLILRGHWDRPLAGSERLNIQARFVTRSVTCLHTHVGDRTGIINR